MSTMRPGGREGGRGSASRCNEHLRRFTYIDGVRTWKVSSEQKLITLPRCLATMCCPAACESSQTDLRFTFNTCNRRCQFPLCLGSQWEH